jgi:hypothetical protein
MMIKKMFKLLKNNIKKIFIIKILTKKIQKKIYILIVKNYKDF